MKNCYKSIRKEPATQRKDGKVYEPTVRRKAKTVPL